MTATAVGGAALVESFLHDTAVPYDSVRTQLQTGDILFAAGRGLASKLIAFGSGSPWSHVGMLLRDPGSDRIMLIEAPAIDTLRIIDLRDLLLGTAAGSAGDRSLKPHTGQIVVARPLAFVADPAAADCATPSARVEALRAAILQRVARGFPPEYDWWEILRIAALLTVGYRWRVWRVRHARRRANLPGTAAMGGEFAPPGGTWLDYARQLRTRRRVHTLAARERRRRTQDPYTCSELVAELLSLHPGYAGTFREGLRGSGFITPADVAEQVPYTVIARIGQ